MRKEVTRRGGGRPVKSPEERAVPGMYTIRVRLDVEERAFLEQLAKAFKCSVGEVLRRGLVRMHPMTTQIKLTLTAKERARLEQLTRKLRCSSDAAIVRGLDLLHTALSG